MKKIQHKKGLTLVEMMVAIVAASIVILTVAVILIMAFRSWRINNAYVEMRRDASLAVYLISRDVRESEIADVSFDNTTKQLTLAAHPLVRSNAVTYRKTGDALASDAFGTIIPRNVTTFYATNSPGGDGVYLTIRITNSTFGIAMDNQVFVNTRN